MHNAVRWIWMFLFSSVAYANGDPLRELTRENPVCFAHRYDAAELAARPAQTVRHLKLKFSVDEYVTTANPNLHVAAAVQRPKGVGKYANDMLCTAGATELSCFIECDGGGATVTWEPQARDGSIVFVNRGFVLHGGCDGEKETIWLAPTPGGDDEFTLEEAPCANK